MTNQYDDFLTADELQWQGYSSERAYLANKARTTTPTASQVDERTDAIGRMLEDAGLSRGMSATATEPFESGLGVEYRPDTNELAIVSSHETFARFAFDAPIEVVEAWIDARASESMVF